MGVVYTILTEVAATKVECRCKVSWQDSATHTYTCRSSPAEKTNEDLDAILEFPPSFQSICLPALSVNLSVCMYVCMYVCPHMPSDLSIATLHYYPRPMEIMAVSPLSFATEIKDILPDWIRQGDAPSIDICNGISPRSWVWKR